MKKYKPTEISIETTHGCSMKCKMCSSCANFPTPIKNELTLPEIFRLLQDGKKIGAKIVSWSGGDPILRPDFWMYIDYADMLGYKQLLYTVGIKYNGVDREPLSYYELKRLKQYDITTIFDLQGSKASIHDKIMDVPGTFDMEMGIIEEGRKIGLKLETHFVPQKDNIKDLEDYVYFLDDLGFQKVSLLRCVPQGRAKENNVLISQKQFRDMQYLIYELKRRKDLNIDIRLGHPINFQFLVEHEITGKLPDENGRINGLKIDCCRGGIDAPLIKPNGDIDVCPAWKDLGQYIAGNVRKEGLINSWYDGHTYKVFRELIHGDLYKNIKSECKDCPFFKWCKGKCVAQRLIIAMEKYPDKPLEELILHEKDPMCWYEIK